MTGSKPPAAAREEALRRATRIDPLVALRDA